MITVDEREARWSRPAALEGAFVAEVGGRVVGVVQVGPDVDDAVGRAGLRGLDVEPAAQGAGMGATLLRPRGRGAARRRLRRGGRVALRGQRPRARLLRAPRLDAPTARPRTTAEAPELRYRQTLAPC